jgi:D-glycero-D-manno-heptose 1,7-bisphosphate phosphatase
MRRAGEHRGGGPLLRQAVIVAGGRGTRLGALTAKTPKPLLDVGGRPFIEHLLFELARFGIEEVLLLVGPYREAFRRALGPLKRNGMTLVLLPEPTPAGTAGALWHARKLLAKRFLMLNGDTFFDGNLLRLAVAAKGAGAMAALDAPDAARYGRIEVAGNRVAAFREKSARGPGLVSAGVYVFDRARVLARIAKLPCSLEHDVLPALAASRSLHAVQYLGRFIDIGVPEALAAARSMLPAWHRRPAAFIELSALANVDNRQVAPHWRKRARKALRRLNDAGYYTLIIAPGTTQGAALRRRLNAALSSQAAHVDALYAARSMGSFETLLEAARAEWPLAESGSFLLTGSPHIVAQSEPYLAVFGVTQATDLDELVAAALPLRA